MSRSSNSLKTSDVITTPIKLKYTASYDCSSIGAYGIRVLDGVNGPVTVTGSVPQDTLNYLSVRHLYYSNYLTGSYLTTTSSLENYLQSTAASGTFDADERYFPTESESRIRILSIPRNVFGEKISRRSFSISSSVVQIVDDGNGNLVDNNTSYYVYLGYYTPEITEWYVYERAEQIGNIIYPQGMVIITNPNYLEIFPYSPIAYADSGSFYTTDTPKTINVLSNDNSGTGTLVPSSVLLSGGDVASFTNNLDGTVTLNTSLPGTYTTNYTVESIVSGACYLESNEAAITVYVEEPITTTTSTTTTTTTVPATTTSTTTSTTTELVTTTSTTTSTTTEPVTTTTSTTTTTVPPTTTTSTTTTTTTVPPTTTTSTTTSTTTQTTYSVGVYAKQGDTPPNSCGIYYRFGIGGTEQFLATVTPSETTCTLQGTITGVPTGTNLFIGFLAVGGNISFNAVVGSNSCPATTNPYCGTTGYSTVVSSNTDISMTTYVSSGAYEFC